MVPLAEILQDIGHMPLPPYIERADEPPDRERYQTVYAQREGAVAAPTAGLHFTSTAGADRRARHQAGEVTLHVGAGTFQPVRVDDIEDHAMHAEFVEVDERVCERCVKPRARWSRGCGGYHGGAFPGDRQPGHREMQPFRGDTDIFIYPGYRFRSVDAMVTNFHLPESTLLMLVSAFAGRESIMAAYQQAMATATVFSVTVTPCLSPQTRRRVVHESTVSYAV